MLGDVFVHHSLPPSLPPYLGHARQSNGLLHVCHVHSIIKTEAGEGLREGGREGGREGQFTFTRRRQNGGGRGPEGGREGGREG